MELREILINLEKIPISPMVICNGLKYRRHNSWLKFLGREVTYVLSCKWDQSKREVVIIFAHTFPHIHNLTCMFRRKSCNPLLINSFFKLLYSPWHLCLLSGPALWMSSLRTVVSWHQSTVKCTWGYHMGDEIFSWNFVPKCLFLNYWPDSNSYVLELS